MLKTSDSFLALVRELNALGLDFSMRKFENGFNSTMDSPDQGAKGIPVTNTIFENTRIKFEVTNAKTLSAPITIRPQHSLSKWVK